jgi:hypothetical protein
MANIKWIGTQELGNEMEPLLKKYETVFIEFEYHADLMRAIRALKTFHPNYRTNLFAVEWPAWNYHNPNNLVRLEVEMMREPNERVYLVIHPKGGTYTVCNRWTVNRTLEKDNGAAIMATTLSYAKE